MRENVTVIFKSFERQKMAKRLYENLQKYYPGVRVVIADDSRKPLDLQGDSLTIIQLPFNSGLSYGLNQALERVDTPYVEFEEAWKFTKKETESLRISARCSSCKLRKVCNTCVAAAIAETGKADGVPEYLCRYTEATVRYLKETSKK